ncbi:hypothetical protein EYF80_040721 [Liparis tanakae]|uniref:Uncharacterized protein n=1 Tax=Liparis tanakae TaxID=230148 RepID=A0A4Z2G8C7_9TELE|nr:hypothetical protein EYF80_040721 [Liparis tanakae]
MEDGEIPTHRMSIKIWQRERREGRRSVKSKSEERGARSEETGVFPLQRRRWSEGEGGRREESWRAQPSSLTLKSLALTLSHPSQERERDYY